VNLNEIVSAGEAIVSSVGTPQMAKPATEVEYRFPTDPSTLNSPQLGSLSLRLTSWLSWTNIELGKIDAELGVLKPMFEVLLDTRISEMKQLEPKLLKGEAKSKLITSDVAIQTAFRRILVLDYARTQLEAKVKVYESQLSKLSREQSRREGEKSGV